jgi:hypothetical protein
MRRDEAIEWIRRTCAEDEDVYPLVARDKLAASLVRLHANLMHEIGTRQDKVDDAYVCAGRMATWPKRKYPD